MMPNQFFLKRSWHSIAYRPIFAETTEQTNKYYFTTMTYRLRVKYRKGFSTGYQTVQAYGTSESAAKEALCRMSSSYSDVTVLNVEVL